MIRLERLVAKAIFLALLSYPQIASAEDFTSATVLGWDTKSQDALFQNSIAMMSIVAAQNPRTDAISDCIAKWYETKALQQQRHDQIRSALKRFPDHHPQVIVLAVVQKACGAFK